MGEWWSTMTEMMTSDRAFMLLRALIIVSIGFVIARSARAALLRVLGKYLDAQQRMVLQRVVYYLLLGLFAVSALRELGFSLSVLLGAAGILSVAIGFASQTSASNLISGLFLIGERPFSVGDVIRINNTTGEVLSIDLLSVKLRTFDNLYVRIPNETVIKSEVTTLTRFPIRRMDLQLQVAFNQDVERVRQLLLDLAAANPLCLEEPKPIFILQNLTEGAVNIQFSVWVVRDQYLELQNSLQSEIQREFGRLEIEIAPPKRMVLAGAGASAAASQSTGRAEPSG